VRKDEGLKKTGRKEERRILDFGKKMSKFGLRMMDSGLKRQVGSKVQPKVIEGYIFSDLGLQV
jgi:hypothetical protein